MNDGMSGLRAQGHRIDTRVLRHMLMETSALLEESQTLAARRDQDHNCASALSTATRRLLGVSTWLSAQFTGDAAASPEALGAAAIAPRIDTDSLPPALRDLTEQVDRLHQRALRLDGLLREPTEPVVRSNPTLRGEDGGPAISNCVVIDAFGGGGTGAAANPVGAARQRLNWAFRYA